MNIQEISMVIILFLLGVIVILLKYISNIKNGLSQLSNKFGKYAKGNFKYRQNMGIIKSIDGLESIMEGVINSADEKLREAKDSGAKLQSILKGASNGIIAIDNEENILILNHVAREIIGYDDIFEGKSLEGIVKSTSLLSEIRDKVYMPKEDGGKPSFIDERYYKIEVNRIKLQKNNEGEVFSVGKVINISDVTEKYMLETLRAEFVTSVTHELRTPITSILGFVETIQENPTMEEQTKARFLGIIEEESIRLKNMIDDILSLSFVENNKITTEKVDVKEVINRAVVLLDKKAVKKNMAIFCSIEGNPKLETNEQYLYQVMINIIDNAIKYSKEGADVEVSCKQNDKEVIIEVKDHGVGISTSDISRIFERFYRVDKSRSAKEKGTGLGLAIVKHMIMAMDGTIEVRSKLGMGSTFILKLKK